LAKKRKDKESKKIGKDVIFGKGQNLFLKELNSKQPLKQ
jgi:hypothetical protein